MAERSRVNSSTATVMAPACNASSSATILRREKSFMRLPKSSLRFSPASVLAAQVVASGNATRNRPRPRVAETGGGRVGRLLVCVPIFHRKSLHPQRRINLRHHRPACQISQPSNGQKWTRSPHCCRMNLSHGKPAWVEFATCPCTSNKNTDFAVAVHCSVKRSHDASPRRLDPSPQRPSRTKRT